MHIIEQREKDGDMAKTVRFYEVGEPKVMRLEDVSVREPGPGEVLLRIDAIGLNRAESLFRRNQYIVPVRQFPATLGNEAAGIIEKLGPGITDFQPGQAVSVVPAFSQNDYGIYSEYAIVPASALVTRAEKVDAVTGATVWMPYLAAIQVANRIGATPIAVTRTEVKKQRLLDEGAADVIVSNFEDVPKRILELTDGHGAHYVFDAVAGPAVVELASAIAADGTLFLWGAHSGQPTPYPGFDLGMPALNMRTYTMLEITRDPQRMRRAIAFINSGLRTQSLRPIVDRVFPLDDIVQAHQYLESNVQFGKIVVSVTH